MDRGKVSVIIPVYNAEKYLEDCIRSVLCQTYNNWEMILVNDGSSDSSEEICNRYAQADDRIKVISQENRGVSAARNVGISNATGKYLTFLDSDDELMENAIEILVTDIIAYNADIATASKVYVTAEKKEISRDSGNGDKVIIFKELEPLRLSLGFDRRMTACHGKMFSRDFIDKTRFVEGKRINEDFFFIFECCAKQPVFTYRDASVYKYFYRDNSVTRADFSEKFFDMLYFSDMKMKCIMEQYPSLIEEAKDMEVSTHLFLLNVLCRDKTGKYKKDIRRSIKIVRQRYFKYRSVNKQEKILSAVVTFGLYPLYKFIFGIKYGK